MWNRLNGLTLEYGNKDNLIDRIDYDEWLNLESLEKAKIVEKYIPDFNYYPSFGYFYNTTYSKLNFSLQDIKIIGKNTCFTSSKEKGGIVDYKNNIANLQFKSVGTDSRIDLNYDSDIIQTVFHTHPIEYTNKQEINTEINKQERKQIKKERNKYDPISVLDIVSFLLINTKSIADCILFGTEIHVKFLSALIFTKNEVYTYYMSTQLIQKISATLRNLWNESIKNTSDINSYIKNTELLLEEIELYYTLSLLNFNKYLTNTEIISYIEIVNSFGIVINRFSYNDNISI